MSSFPLPAFFDFPISFISVLLVVPLLCTEVCHFLHLWQFVSPVFLVDLPVSPVSKQKLLFFI